MNKPEHQMTDLKMNILFNNAKVLYDPFLEGSGRPDTETGTTPAFGKVTVSYPGRKLIGSNPGLLLLTALISIFFGSCSNLRYLDDDQRLYTGSRVIFDSPEPIRNKSELQNEAESVIRPEPNTRILIWRPQLWFYNIAGDGDGAISRWIRNTLGRPPVLFEEIDTDRTARLIENRLYNMGHFDAVAGYSLREKTKRTEVIYQVDLKTPYVIRNIYYPNENIAIAEDINNSSEGSLLQSGNVYRLETLKNERERIDTYLKELGYYYFHPDFLLFWADSTAGDREVDLHLTIKPATPQYALERYYIRNIQIESGFTLETPAKNDTDNEGEINDGVYVDQGMGILKARTLNRAIFFEQDSLYRNTAHRQTISHLIGMGIFRFVNIRFERIEDNQNYLDVRILLTPADKKNISTEVRGLTKSNNFAGPGLSASFTNRNFLRGAENFSISIDGAFETLMGQRGVNSTEFGISTELSIPRLIIPYKLGTVSPRFIPRTRMSLSYSFMHRTDAFSLSSFRSQFGYIWNPSRSVEHRLNPFVFNAFSLGTISPEYQDIFSREVLLRRGLFEQFLIGSEYAFMYQSQLARHRRHDWYFNFNIDLSGNLARLASGLLGAEPVGENGDYRILNHSFSQFTRTDIDLRYYNNLGRNTRIATRLIAGIGVPYGNSTSLPFTKLFVIGGTNSIRAFHPRTLGPGAYIPPDDLGTTFNIYQSGEIKLEMNIEYRFAFSNTIKGAFFADAGNIWNIEEDENAPGGQFHASEFLSQIALGTGMGLRFDFNFFLLRLDLAFPLAIPYSETAGYFENIRPLDSQWRRDNLILNVAIGYPF
jgi:outer membrane protein insertion porin family